jgi:hypothetical protein
LLFLDGFISTQTLLKYRLEIFGLNFIYYQVTYVNILIGGKMLECITNLDIINFVWGTIQSMTQNALYDGVKKILGIKFEKLFNYKEKDDMARFSQLLETELEENPKLAEEIGKIMSDKSKTCIESKISIVGDINSNGGSVNIGNITHG